MLEVIITTLAVLTLVRVSYSCGLYTGRKEVKKCEHYIKTAQDSDEVEYTCVICGKKGSREDMMFSKDLVPICRSCYEGIMDLEKKEIKK